MPRPFFSVIIPNYNHEKFLRARIQSVLRQSFTDFEIILLDDASSDNSRAVLLEYQNHPSVGHVVLNDANSGSPFKQWQKGIALAAAPFIWIAESDDRCDPDFLKTAYQVITTQQIEFFYSDTFYIDANDGILDKASAIKNDFFETDKWSHDYVMTGLDDLNEHLKYLCTVNNSSAMVVQKMLAETIIEQSTEYKYCGDWLFFINAFLTARVGYRHQALCSYRTSATGHLNRAPNITETKKEYFRLLRHLLSLKEIEDKNSLITFFARHYLGFGILYEGLQNGLTVFKQYLLIDRKLGWRIIRKVLANRLLLKQNKKRYT